MNGEFIPHEQAAEINGLGFDIRPDFGNQTSLYSTRKTHVFYTNYGVMGSGLGDGYIYAPTFSQAFRWFREKYNLICGVQYMGKNKINWWDIYVVGHYNIHYEEMCMKHQSYEEAELECLNKLIEIVKNK